MSPGFLYIIIIFHQLASSPPLILFHPLIGADLSLRYKHWFLFLELRVISTAFYSSAQSFLILPPAHRRSHPSLIAYSLKFSCSPLSPHLFHYSSPLIFWFSYRAYILIEQWSIEGSEKLGNQEQEKKVRDPWKEKESCSQGRKAAHEILQQAWGMKNISNELIWYVDYLQSRLKIYNRTRLPGLKGTLCDIMW